MNDKVTIPIRTAFDVITARVKVREFARQRGLDITGQARISLAAYSLANASELGGKNEGQLVVNSLKQGKRMGVEVTCIIPAAANDHLAAEAFENVRWLVDEFTVETLPSSEVRVALTQWSPPPKEQFQWARLTP
jgi:hypothetical protein